VSNIELPPLTHDKITFGYVLLDFFVSNSHRHLPDPYFQDSGELSDYERRGMARDIRAQARIFYHRPIKYISYIVLGFLFGGMFLAALVGWIPATIYVLVKGVYLKDYHFWLLYAVLSWSLVIYKVREHLRVINALKTLALRFPGSVGTDRNLEFLAWLDAHWPAMSPMDEIESIHGPLPGGRWELESSYLNCPLLIRVCDLGSLRNSTPWRRYSIYLSVPRSGFTNNRLPENIKADFDKLGYHAFPSPAGMFMCHNGRSMEALNPERIARLLDLAYRTIHERNGQ